MLDCRLGCRSHFTEGLDCIETDEDIRSSKSRLAEHDGNLSGLNAKCRKGPCCFHPN